MIVTAHAISRYRERVEPVSYDEAHARLTTDRIRKGIEFGAREIILGTGHHAVVVDGCIVTVRPKPVTKPRKSGRWRAEAGPLHSASGVD